MVDVVFALLGRILTSLFNLFRLETDLKGLQVVRCLLINIDVQSDGSSSGNRAALGVDTS